MSLYDRYPRALSRRAAGIAPLPGATPFVRNKIARSDANTRGRDFIVGDLHGCAEYLDTLMRHVGFDPCVDRLFSVGDLVDRGTDSVETLKLLEQPWFYPVMGNHDAMLLAALMEHAGLLPGLAQVDHARADIYADAFFGNGGDWLTRFLRDCRLQDETRANTLVKWRERLQEMPLIRVVGGENRFHVAHAELLTGPANGKSFADNETGCWSDLALDQPDAEGNPLWDHPHHIEGFDMVGDGVDHLLWGRELRALAAGGAVPDIQGLSRTYVGHTITVLQDRSQLLTAGSHVFLDTGAYMSATAENRNAGLTVWCHTEHRGWNFNGAKIVAVQVQRG